MFFVVIHFGFLRYAHHFGAITFGSLADVNTKKRPMPKHQPSFNILTINIFGRPLSLRSSKMDTSLCI